MARWECGELLNRGTRKNGGTKKTDRMGRTERTDREVGVVHVGDLATCVKAWESLQFFQVVGCCCCLSSRPLLVCLTAISSSDIYEPVPRTAFFSSATLPLIYTKGLKVF